MPWPAHNYVEFGGRRSSVSDEIWQCGLRVCKPEDDGETVPWGLETFDSTDTETYVKDLAVWAVRWWFQRPESMIAPHCWLDWVSSTWIMPSGARDPAYSYREELAEPVTGGGLAAPVMPFQTAMVITFTSNVRHRGAGSHGRIFSPAPAVQLGSGTGRFDPALAAGAAASASRLVEQLAFGNLPTGDRRHPHIVSRSAGGLRSRIDYVSVDTRLDVLRKRADYQEPERVVHTVDHDWWDG